MDFKCMYCYKEFKYKYYLDRHYNRKNSCNMVENTRCFICLKDFSSKDALKKHMNKQTQCQPMINTQNTINGNHNVINNKIYVNYINRGDKEYKEQIMHQIVDQFKITNCLLIKLALSSDNDENDNLNNPVDCTNLINAICMNIHTPENWRFIYDNMSRILKIQVNNNVVDFEDNFLEFVYRLYKEVVNCQFVKDIDPKLIGFYTKFIDDYENNIYEDLNINEFLNQCQQTIFGCYMELINELDAQVKGKGVIGPKPIGTLINMFDKEDLTIVNQTQTKTIKLILNKIRYGYGNINNYQYKSLKCTFDELMIYDIFIRLFRTIYIDNKNNTTIQYINGNFRIYQKNKNGKKWVIIRYDLLLIMIFIKFKEFNKLHEIYLPDMLLNEFQIKRIECDDSDSDSDSKKDQPFDLNHLSKFKKMLKYMLQDSELTNMCDHIC